jgi:hypothetical protein
MLNRLASAMFATFSPQVGRRTCGGKPHRAWMAPRRALHLSPLCGERSPRAARRVRGGLLRPHEGTACSPSSPPGKAPSVPFDARAGTGVLFGRPCRRALAFISAVTCGRVRSARTRPHAEARQSTVSIVCAAQPYGWPGRVLHTTRGHDGARGGRAAFCWPPARPLARGRGHATQLPPRPPARRGCRAAARRRRPAPEPAWRPSPAWPPWLASPPWRRSGRCRSSPAPPSRTSPPGCAGPCRRP